MIDTTAGDEPQVVRRQTPRPLLDRLWSTLTAPEIHKQLQTGTMWRGDLDAAVNYYTSGKLKTFSDLAQTRTRAERVGLEQELQRLKIPSQATAMASGAANEMALGIPEKLAPFAHGSGQGSTPAQDFTSALQAGRDEFPKSTALAETAGNMVPSTAVGNIAEHAAGPLLTRILSRLGAPAVMKMMGRGALAGGSAAAASEYGAAPALKPDPKRIGTAAAFGAPFGAAAAVPAWWAATKLNPMEHIASRSVMESAPGDTPSMAAGTAALQGGKTSSMPIGRPGPEESVFRANTPDANARLPEPLQQLNFERSPVLRANAAKLLTADPEAANTARLMLTRRIASVRVGLSKIEEGYEPLLKTRALTPEDIAGLPDGAQRAMSRLESPTARDLFKRYKSLRDQSSSIFNANESGTLADASKLDDAASMRAESRQLREWLGQNVDTFDRLQRATGTWLQRLDELNIGRRQIVGRAIKPLGKSTVAPSGAAAEGYKELAGFASQQIASRAARRLAPILLSPRLSDLMNAAHNPDLSELVPNLIRSIPAFAGTAGPDTRDLSKQLLPRQ